LVQGMSFSTILPSGESRAAISGSKGASDILGYFARKRIKL
jgi:hypothetical protein